MSVFSFYHYLIFFKSNINILFMLNSFSHFFKKNYVKILFLFIIILCVLLRIQHLDKSLQKDETPFFEASRNLYTIKIPLHSEGYYYDSGELVKSHCRSPLFLLYLGSFINIFGLNEVALRLSIVIISVLTVALMYFVGSMIGGKKLGLISSFLLAISRLHVEHSQIIDTDGSVLTFLTLLSIFFLLKLWKSNKGRYIIFSSITIAAAFLVKEPILLIFPPLFLYHFQKRDLLNFFAILIFSILFSIVSLLLFSYFSSTDFLGCSIRWISSFVFNRAANPEYYQNRLFQFIGISSWDLTPPLLILLILSIFHLFKLKNVFRFFIYFTIIFFTFYIAIMGITRYFVPILPVTSLLIGYFILESKILSKPKNIVLVSIIALLCIAAFYLFRIRTDVLFLNDISKNLYLISIPYILSVIPLVLYFTRYRRLAILVLFGMLIGYNIYFAQEAVNPLVSPDYGKVTVETSDFIKTNSLQDPLVTNHDIGFYAHTRYYDILGPFMSAQYLKDLTSEHKPLYVVYRTNTVIIQPGVEEFLETKCQKIGSGISRNIEIFKAYRC